MSQHQERGPCDLAESIVGGGEEWLTELSTADLKEYLRLSEQAVGEF